MSSALKLGPISYGSTLQKKSMQVKRHEGGSPTTTLTLQKADKLSRGHLKLFGKPSKRGNRLTLICT
jgi:hypothetical protein